MLNKEELKQLRKEIVLNSLFLNDYKNSVGIRKKDACNFFDSYLEYLSDLSKEDNKNMDIIDIIDKYDTTYNLYNFYCLYEDDPLKKMDAIIEEMLDKYMQEHPVIEIYPSYNDFEDIESLLYRNVETSYGYKKIMLSYDDFCMDIVDAYQDACDEEIKYYVKQFIQDIKDEDIKEYIENYYFNELENIVNDNVYIQYPIKDFEKREIKINIFWSKKNQSGFENTWLKYLLHSQSYKVKDHNYLKKMLNNEKLTRKENQKKKEDYKNSIFFKSLIEEIENLWKDSPRDLCFIASVSIYEYFMLLEENKNFTISKDAIGGLVDMYNGGGSLLGITLEKDITMNTSDIEIKIEKVNKYTVNDIYGLTSGCFKNCIRGVK